MKKIILTIVVCLMPLVSFAYDGVTGATKKYPKETPPWPQNVASPTFTKKSKQPAIIILKEFEGMTYQEMYLKLGPPADKTGYTIKNAPTKSWNHAELFAKYPKVKNNFDVQIMEVTWDAGDYQLLACYHMVKGQNCCLVAKKILKGVRF